MSDFTTFAREAYAPSFCGAADRAHSNELAAAQSSYEAGFDRADRFASLLPIATEDCLQDMLLVAEFFQEGDAIREASSAFGFISDPELCVYAFGEEGSDTQRLEACKELGKRMREYMKPSIEKRAERLMDF